MDRTFEGFLSTWREGGGGLIQPPSQCLGLYLSVANKTCQIYEKKQNKVIDINKNMLTLQNVADVIKN